ncbi:hypothetical protein I4F81_001436 [Pyropia yezoensis]|uniref:Uncharacterized protein n=1 Tax=Pyropia yezoensis TaxID=2788 RepID=A0ACC3BM71_PYRYE|nr:hypothetical protein I4F81_001436 [Neopyropia yezoensis]
MSTLIDGPPPFLPGDTAAYAVVAWTITVAQYATCAVFLLFLAHKLLMLVVYPYVTRFDPVPGTLPRDRPFVTVQLPCYNESAVIRRVIDAACSMNWPRDRYEVHVLDDSNDQTTAIAEDAAAFWRASGTECRVIRRPVRTGYKAGALQWDIDQEVHPDSRFFPVFDADFAPAPGWLEEAMPYFFDAAGRDVPTVSMVQGRWAHLNADTNLLTRLQEVILNGHFWIEQVFRSRTGRPWNFNGTAGVWRRSAIAAVGGWEHDTIVEDSDLSIKCYDAGYRGVFVRDLSAPSELPVAIADYRSQQTRWIKGFGQLFAKKARAALTSPNTGVVAKAEFLFHTLPSVCYAATVVFQLYFPLAVFVDVPFSWAWLGVNVGGLAIFWAFYALTLVRTFGLLRGLAAQWRIPGVMVLCWGLAPLLAWAFVQGLFSHDATFTRTPKRAATVASGSASSGGGASASASATSPTGPSAGMSAGSTPTATTATTSTTRSTDGSATAPTASRSTSAHTAGGGVSVDTADGGGAGAGGGSSDGDATASTGDDASAAASAAAAAAASRAAVAKASYWTVKLSPLPLFEAAMAGWSAFAAVAAVFALAAAPLNEGWNTGRLWLIAVVIFCAGSAVGLGWNAGGALAGMAGGVAADVGAAAARRRSRRDADRLSTGGEGGGAGGDGRPRRRRRRRAGGGGEEGGGGGGVVPRRSRSEGDVPSGGESLDSGSADTDGGRSTAAAAAAAAADADADAAAVAASRARAAAAAKVAAAALAAVPPPPQSGGGGGGGGGGDGDRAATHWPPPVLMADADGSTPIPDNDDPYATRPPVPTVEQPTRAPPRASRGGGVSARVDRAGPPPPPPPPHGRSVRVDDVDAAPAPAPAPAAVTLALPRLPPRPPPPPSRPVLAATASEEEDEDAMLRALGAAFGSSGSSSGGGGGDGGGSPPPGSPWAPRPPPALRQRPSQGGVPLVVEGAWR